jgi:C1A family cysteine protease
MSRTIQGYGWKPSLPDHRDQVADVGLLPVLPEVDPRGDYMTPIYDQGQLGSCTANTIAEALDAWRIVNDQEAFYPSRLALYALERLREGSPLDQDTGAYGRDGLWVSQHSGFIREKDMPYSDRESAWSKDPRPLIAKLKGSDDWSKLYSPYKVVPRSVTSFKRVLSNRQTIAIGFTVYESFESDEVARSGVMPYPEPGERQLGGHEVLVVGYLKAEPGYFLVRNHWGKDWGIGGYFLMPQQVILDAGMSEDFRTIYHPSTKGHP